MRLPSFSRFTTIEMVPLSTREGLSKELNASRRLPFYEEEYASSVERVRRVHIESEEMASRDSRTHMRMVHKSQKKSYAGNLILHRSANRFLQNESFSVKTES